MPMDGRLAIVTPCNLIETWVTRQLGTVEHERNVMRIATQLFTLTQPLHGLDIAHRRLLQKAALVHDVGRSKDVERHPQVGARMVMDACLPMTSLERRVLAYLTRYHRGAVPGAGKDGILHASDPHHEIRLLLALLRAADALDSRSLGSCDLAFALRRDRVKIRCWTDGQTTQIRKILSKRKKFRMLEELLHLRVKIVVEHDTAHSLVA